jgi:hypothetical protein
MDVDFWSFPEKRGPTPAKLRTREKVGGFFSPEAGQARRNWLNSIDDRIAEGLRYYLGPSGVDQKVTAAAQGGQMLMDGADFQDAYTAGGDLMQSRSIPEAAANFLEFAAPAAAVMIPGVSNRMLQGAGDMAEDAARFVVDESGALRIGGGSPAQQVADLLASGRAADVTDEMLAKLTPNDNAELFKLYQSGATGADMPMDVASRMQRAEGMGFDMGTPLYHGTYTDFPAFEARPGTYGDGTYFGIDDPKMASKYASRQSTTSLDPPGSYGTGAAVIPANGPKDVGYSPKNTQPTQAAVDPTPNIRLITNPANIRSRFARFDPRLSHLANLSAAGAGVAVINGQDDLTPEEQFRRMWWAQQPQKGNSQ